MKRRYFLFFAIFFPVLLFGQTVKVSIANFSQDSLMVPVSYIAKDPIIRFSGLQNNKIISCELFANVSGVVYSWNMSNKDSLSKKIIQVLSEVKDAEIIISTIGIDNVKYLKSDSTIGRGKGLFLFLTKETNLCGKYHVEYDRYINGKVKFAYYYCDTNCFKIDCFRRNGLISGTKYYPYSSDKIVIITHVTHEHI